MNLIKASKYIKWILGVILIFVLLLSALYLSVYIPPVQRFLKSKIESAASEALKADVHIQNFELGFFARLQINQLNAVRNRDTLLEMDVLELNLQFKPLFKHRIVLEEVKVSNLNTDYYKLIPDDTSDTDENEQENAWTFSLRNVEVRNSNIILKDTTMDLRMDIGLLSIENIDIDSFVFSSDYILIDSTIITYYSPFNPRDTSTDSALPDFILKTVKADLRNSSFDYNDNLMKFNVGGKSLETRSFAINLNAETIKMGDISLDESWFRMQYINDTLDTIDGGYDWKVWLSKAKIQNSDFVYDLTYAPEMKNEFDYNHLHFYKINSEAEDVFWSFNKMSGRLLNLAANENNRVQILNSSGRIYADNDSLEIRDLIVKTSLSDIQLDLLMAYDLYTFEYNLNEPFRLNLNLNTGKWDDLIYFGGKELTEIEEFDQLKDKPLNLKVNLNGIIDSLQISINGNYNYSSKLISQGFLQSNANDTYSYAFHIADLQIGKRDIELFTSDSSVLGYIPESMGFSGEIKGDVNTTDIVGSLTSPMGNQHLKLKIGYTETGPDIQSEIKGNLKYDELNISKLYLLANLRGSDISTLESDIELKLQDIFYEQVHYDSMQSSGVLDSGQFQADFALSDPKAKMHILSQGKVSNTSIQMYNKIAIDTLNLPANGVSGGINTIAFSSNFGLSMDFDTKYADLGGVLSGFILTDSSGTNKIDLINFAAEYKENESHLDISTASNTVKLDIYGNLDTLRNNIRKFVDIVLLKESRNYKDSLHFPDIELYVDINRPQEIINGEMAFPLPKFSSFNAEGKYSNSHQFLDLKIFMPDLDIEGNIFDSTGIEIAGNRNALEYKLFTNIYLDSLVQTDIKIDGELVDKILLTHLNLSDRRGLDFIDLELKSRATDDGYLFHLMNDSLTILSNHWMINKGNLFRVTKDDLIAKDIKLHRADKSISISTNELKKEVSLSLENIDLDVFNRIMRDDSMLYGQMDSRLSVYYGKRHDRINFIAGIDSLMIENNFIGDIDIYKAKLSDTAFAFKGDWRNAVGSMSVNTLMGIGDNEKIHADIKTDNLNLNTLNDFLSDYLYDLTGQLESNIHIRGSYDNPLINGFLQFRNISFASTALRENFSFNNKKLYVKNNILNLNGLKLYDGNKNTAVFEGHLKFESDNIIFDNLHLSSGKFQIMKSTMEENELIYGSLVANMDLYVNGDLNKLTAKNKIILDYPTEVNYIMPEDLSVADNEDLVVFHPIDTLSINEDNSIVDTLKQRFKTIGLFDFLSTELVVKEGCKFNLYFDKTREDFISITGNGDIIYTQSNDIPKVSGIFYISKGLLNYSMPMVSMEKLEISPGSYLQFTNDIENPMVHIDASSKIWAQTGDLIEDYNKNLEVKVLVYMRGSLENLIVQFDVSPETSDPLISSRIAQMTEKERTMNAVNLLVRGQFASRQNSMTVDVSSYVEGLFAKALNKLISDRIKFVDMSFDIKSFNHINSAGAVEAQSNMFFTVRKSFYHNRLRISYQGNFSARDNDVADPYSATESYTENNLMAEFDINKTGSFQAVVFRKDAYEDLLEGEITSTGGGLKIKKSYYSFGDIFRPNPQKRQKKGSKKK